jgi:hypothetical protein
MVLDPNWKSNKLSISLFFFPNLIWKSNICASTVVRKSDIWSKYAKYGQNLGVFATLVEYLYFGVLEVPPKNRPP